MNKKQPSTALEILEAAAAEADAIVVRSYPTASASFPTVKQAEDAAERLKKAGCKCAICLNSLAVRTDGG